MCLTRRDMIAGGAVLMELLHAAADGNPLPREAHAHPEVGKVDELAPGVYFHEGDLAKQGHCNNGWIIFDDYVLVIDANFPSGALTILPKIRALTDKPVRFAFDTHHHGDHAYGNQVWVDNGATPVAHTGVIEEMKRYETGYYGGKPGRWEDTAKGRADMQATKLKPPSLLFPNELFFDDGKHRVELHHLGVAHTHGDAVAWLPNEKILFTGDVCVNGPYNYVGDGDVEKWIKTLEAAQKLGGRVICPGHGPRDFETMLSDQRRYFQALREQVGLLVKAKKGPEEVKAAAPQIFTRIAAETRIARYADKAGIVSQIEKVYTEMTGRKFAMHHSEHFHAARRLHARDHGVMV